MSITCPMSDTLIAAIAARMFDRTVSVMQGKLGRTI